MTAALICRDEHRRQRIRERSLNGIDFIDVHGKDLCVHFLTGIPKEFLPATEGPGKGKALTPDQQAAALAHIVIRGGRRITGIHATAFRTQAPVTPFDESCLRIRVNREGDWSEYTLCFAGIPSLDPRYACAGFQFKVDCPAEIDCKTPVTCPAEVRPAPAISYLAKDYATFRQLIFDRLSVVMPDWRERHVPDIGVALVELLAYTADYLSYYQDAVGTEQYLDTARQRISVRRHLRLIDYAMHEGCNARVFVHLQVTGDAVLDARNIYFATRPRMSADAPASLREPELAKLPPGWLQFEPLTEQTTIELYEAHNLITIYTWGDRECCLPRGATHATLLDETEEHDEYNPQLCAPPPPAHPDHCHDHYDGCGCPPPPPEPAEPRVLHLQPGDFLLFEEPDGDRTHRHVVRLTKVTPGCDALLGNRVLEVEWSREDALPFALCVSAIGNPPGCQYIANIGIARGNIVPADHGATVFDEPLDAVPERPFADRCEGEGSPIERARVPGRYRPILRHGPLTFAEPPAAAASASAVMRQNVRAALPAIAVGSIPAAFLGAVSLFRVEDLHDVHALASSLLEPQPEQKLLIALRRRLRPEVVKLLDAARENGDVTDELVQALDANLRASMETWAPRADLLHSSDDAHFVAEIDDEGLAHLRFGDGDAGRAVEVGMSFAATYRTGNGRAGLVGPESIAHVVFRGGFNNAVTLVRNPLPSGGAAEPETVAEAKILAPTSVRKDLQRAVTAGDYATLAQYLRYPDRNPRVQSAAGEMRFNGSWYEAGVAVDAFGSSELDDDLRASVAGQLHRYRRMGHDLHVSRADAVPLRVELELLVAPRHLRAHVVAAVRDALSNRVLPDGRFGFFHPDRLSFGAAIHVSRIVAAVMAVDGVVKVCVARLERLGEPRGNPDFANGLLKLGPTEIARLDNDPALPENGLLLFTSVGGGR